jgi:hypothetical protein
MVCHVARRARVRLRDLYCSSRSVQVWDGRRSQRDVMSSIASSVKRCGTCRSVLRPFVLTHGTFHTRPPYTHRRRDDPNHTVVRLTSSRDGRDNRLVRSGLVS